MKTVQFITHYTEKYSYLDSARMALKGGCRWIQLRMKDAGKEEIVSVAMELRNLCNDCGAIFIITTMWSWSGKSGRTACTLVKMTCPLPKRGAYLETNIS